MSTFCDKHQHREYTFRVQEKSKDKTKEQEKSSMLVRRRLGSVVNFFFTIFNRRRGPGSVSFSVVSPSFGRCTPSLLRSPASPPPLSAVAFTPIRSNIPVLVAIIPLGATTRAARTLTVPTSRPMGRRGASVVTPYRRGRIFRPL